LFQANTFAVPEQDLKSFDLDMTTGGAKINGNWYDENTFLDTFQIGDVVEMSVQGVRVHPMHMHVNPVQIISLPADSNSYFQAGDWHGRISPLIQHNELCMLMI